MLQVHEADTLLSSLLEPFPVETVELERSHGRILRQPIAADRPYPTLDTVRMDGIAISMRDWESGLREFSIQGIVRAGEPRRALTNAGECLEVMTGAPCPSGCDTVLPYEEIRLADGLAQYTGKKPVLKNQHVHPKGTDCSEGQLLLSPGMRLTAPRIAIAASVGHIKVDVTRRPRIFIVATGDELVDPQLTPLPHQVRVSNSFAVRALLERFGEIHIGKVADQSQKLEVALKAALASNDMIIITGGVSAGKFDFVPEALKHAGVASIFHKIAQKPGKPLWVGYGQTNQPVFGLPGNPVSALICARRYIVPVLQAKSGIAPVPAPLTVRLIGDFPIWEKGTQFIPVTLHQTTHGVWEAHRSPTNGSGDFSSLGNSDGFVEIKPGLGYLAAHEGASYWGWEI